MERVRVFIVKSGETTGKAVEFQTRPLFGEVIIFEGTTWRVEEVIHQTRAPRVRDDLPYTDLFVLVRPYRPRVTENNSEGGEDIGPTGGRLLDLSG